MRLASQAIHDRDSYLAHAALGEAYTHLAVETNEVDYVILAIEQLQAAKTFMPDSPDVLGAYVFPNLVACVWLTNWAVRTPISGSRQERRG